MGIVPQNQSIKSALVFAAGSVVIFIAASSSLGFFNKVLVAIGVLIFGLALVLFGMRNKIEGEPPESKATERSDTVSLEEELATFEEAAVFFSASMEPEEMLRLVAARLESVLSGTVVNFFLDEGGELPRQVVGGRRNVDGDSAERFRQLTFLAQRACSSVEILRGKTDDLRSIVAPLVRGPEVIAVLSLSDTNERALPNDDTVRMLAARIEPLIAGSFSFASSITNALTDNLTGLPNERAMYLILENQVAEAQRFGSVRPLTLLAMDISSFDKINQSFGHSAGDRLLTFVGGLIREQLRQMDFLARTSDDEFLLILPTAESGSSENVRARIEEAFDSSAFILDDDTEHKIGLCFGSATFGEDADTASGLIKAALESKQLDKSAEKGRVIRFPKNSR